jgi:hypothetical protein
MAKPISTWINSRRQHLHFTCYEMLSHYYSNNPPFYLHLHSTYSEMLSHYYSNNPPFYLHLHSTYSEMLSHYYSNSPPFYLHLQILHLKFPLNFTNLRPRCLSLQNKNLFSCVHSVCICWTHK